jgi:coproporphyrinogen III oxidase-like Fe-S oxidoreductase/pyruvate-formate lyase-activating enzyme
MYYRQIHPKLPIFCFNQKECSVIYTPGHLCACSHIEEKELESVFFKDSIASKSKVVMLAEQLIKSAHFAADTWKKKLEEPFSPECLTISLSNQCNMNCSYCFVTPGNGKQDKWTRSKDLQVVTDEAVKGAAHLVAQNCARKNESLKVVLHGGGEPTVHWKQLQRIVEMTHRVADQYKIDWWGYLATNGILTSTQAQWAADHFDLVGLSCDGPPEIQNCQRPMISKKNSSFYVERTAQILAESGKAFLVRSTITPQTVERQVEIVDYLMKRLGPAQMRFEPVFRVEKDSQLKFTANQAEWFVDHFLHARQQAINHGYQLDYSGIRLDEIHGPYCDVFRNVLRLIPGDLASMCFLCTEPDIFPNTSQSTVVGHFNKETGEFILKPEQITAHRKSVGRIPPNCQKCINIYHCARECPNRCLTVTDSSEGNKPGFRCRVNHLLAETWILEAAKPLVGAQKNPEIHNNIHNKQNCHPGKTRLSLKSGDKKRTNKLLSFLENIPTSSIDIDAILRQWEVVKSYFTIERRSLPPPIWKKREFEHDGKFAWQQLSQYVSCKSENEAISIYLHVPFCDRHCRFCDCYSKPLGKKNRNEEKRFVETLLQEMDSWSRIPRLRHRPITTIHFGGGTPNLLNKSYLAQILKKFRTQFGVTPQTEWALESTSSLLNEKNLNQLQQWGFNRLHVGVQTLENTVRQLIGRRDTSNKVEEKLLCALKMGFIVSVDLIYGLPQQTVPGLITTLKRLVNIGIHGFSLYQLQVSDSNRDFLERMGIPRHDSLFAYVLFQAAEQILINYGYRKNHFTHFALPKDTNLYYTHGVRSEDLLALGPTADGVFAGYHYRHPVIEEYVATNSDDTPVLEGGLRETDLEQKMRPSIAALMGGRIFASLLHDLDAEFLLKSWQERKLLEPSTHPDQFVLTANGSWLITHMIELLIEWVESHF